MQNAKLLMEVTFSASFADDHLSKKFRKIQFNFLLSKGLQKKV